MTSIILVGMPGAGKSTVGVVLAKLLAMDFVDTDVLIQQQTGMHLQTIVDQQGYMMLRQIEAEVLNGLQLGNTVIATGGSAVYSQPAMEHLKRLGPVVYLEVPLMALQARISNLESRGLACAPGEGLTELYNERVPLYQHYADYVVTCEQGDTADAVAEKIKKQLQR